MRLAGWTPLSLSDFPGCTAAVVFTAGCPWRCPFCHNGAALETAGRETWPDLYARLALRRRLLDGVVFSGGEPTLQPDLAAALADCRALGLKTKLDTNGARPEVLAALLDAGLLDAVAMDIKAPWDRYAELAGTAVDVTAVQRSVALIAASGLPHGFRTTHVPALLSEADLARIAAQVPPGSPHRVQPFVPETALDPSLRRAG